MMRSLDKPILMAGSKPLRTEFGINHGFKSCGIHLRLKVVAQTFNNLMQVMGKFRFIIPEDGTEFETTNAFRSTVARHGRSKSGR